MSSEIVLRAKDKPILPFVSACLMVAVGAYFASAAQSFAALGVEVDSSAERAVLLFAVGVVGLFASARVGLQLWPESWARVWCVGLLCAAGTAAFIIIVDCFIFRQILTPDYLTALRQPLGARLLYFPIRAFVENTIYHLFVLSLLVLAFGTVWRKTDGSPSDGAFWAAIILSQVGNIVWNLVLMEPMTPTILGYDTIRYVVPGCLWGYLFWRCGFVTAEIGHVATHFFLQPAFNIWLR